MSGPGNERARGRQGCWEPGREPVQGGNVSEGEPSVCEKGEKPGSNKGGTSVCEKGEKTGSNKGETSVCEKGEKPGSNKGGTSVCEKGEEPGSNKGEDPGSNKGEKPGSNKGGTSVCEKGEKPGSNKGEEPGSNKGEKPGSNKGGTSVCEKGEEPGSNKGEKPGSNMGETPVCEKEKSMSNKVEKPGRSKGEQKKASVSDEGAASEGETDWKLKCESAWKLKEGHIPMPDNLNWREIYQKTPFGRNFLKSSNPEGLSSDILAPTPPVNTPPPRMPLESYGDFSGWKVSTEDIPVDTSRIPPGVVVCYLPNYSWCIKEQLVDLVSEGLWAELLDSLQPQICVLDWYEDSKLHKFVYELHVKLLGADQKTVIQEFSLTPEDSMNGDSTGWKNVSHVFEQYGPGVRYVHFQHKSKDLFVVGFHRTRLTNSTVFVKMRE